jgi:hypothetical protein
VNQTIINKKKRNRRIFAGIMSTMPGKWEDKRLKGKNFKQRKTAGGLQSTIYF